MDQPLECVLAVFLDTNKKNTSIKSVTQNYTSRITPEIITFFLCLFYLQKESYMFFQKFLSTNFYSYLFSLLETEILTKDIYSDISISKTRQDILLSSETLRNEKTKLEKTFKHN